MKPGICAPLSLGPKGKFCPINFQKMLGQSSLPLMKLELFCPEILSKTSRGRFETYQNILGGKKVLSNNFLTKMAIFYGYTRLRRVGVDLPYIVNFLE